MLQTTLSCYSSLWVLVKHLSQQILGVCWESLVGEVLEIEITISVLIQDIVVVSAREDGSSCQEDVEDEPNREYVRDRVASSLEILDVNNLWGHISRGSASHK